MSVFAGELYKDFSVGPGKGVRFRQVSVLSVRFIEVLLY